MSRPGAGAAVTRPPRPARSEVRSGRTVALAAAILAVAASSACGAPDGHEGADGDGPRHSTPSVTAVTPEVAAILADGVVTDAEYRRAVESTRRCTHEAGVEVTDIRPSVNVPFLEFDFVSTPETLTAVRATYQRCWERHQASVDDRYAARVLAPVSARPTSPGADRAEGRP